MCITQLLIKDIKYYCGKWGCSVATDLVARQLFSKNNGGVKPIFAVLGTSYKHAQVWAKSQIGF